MIVGMKKEEWDCVWIVGYGHSTDSGIKNVRVAGGGGTDSEQILKGAKNVQKKRKEKKKKPSQPPPTFKVELIAATGAPKESQRLGCLG